MLQTRAILLRSCVLKPLTNYVTTQRNTHIESKVQVSDGIKLNYVQTGSGDKSVLLMPGAMGSAWTDFTPQIEKLPQLLPNHTIIAWDPPGYGKSRPPARVFGLDYLAKDASYAVDLMRTLGRPKFSIVGWSGGGITGIIAAGRYTENIEKLVVWGCNAFISDLEEKKFHDMRTVSSLSPRARAPLEEMYGADGLAKMWYDFTTGMLNIYKERKGNLALDELEKIKAPTLILHGVHDVIITSQHPPYLLKHIKGSKYYEFPNGKHNIHQRYADEFNKVVSDFLLEKS